MERAQADENLRNQNAELLDRLRQAEERLEDQRKKRKTNSGAAKAASVGEDNIKQISSTAIDSAELELIYDSVSNFVFPKLVFMPMPHDKKNHRHIMKVTYKYLENRPDEEVMSKYLWLGSRGDRVAGTFNGIRQYITGAVKKAVRRYSKFHLRKQWPDLEKIRKCALRTIDLPSGDNAGANEESDEDSEELQANAEELQANLDLFEWYWLDLLGAAVPAKTKLWDKNTRKAGLISDSMEMTSHLEAFAILACENSWKYWENWYKLKDKYKGKKLEPCAEKNLPTEPEKLALGHFLEDGVVYFWGEDYETQYSNTKGGSNPYHGWSDEGKDRFVELNEAIEAARNDPVKKAKETIVLEVIQSKDNKKGRRPTQRRVEPEDLPPPDAISRMMQANLNAFGDLSDTDGENGDERGDDESSTIARLTAEAGANVAET